MNDLGWSDADVKVTFDCYDGLSGIDVVPSPRNVTTEGADQTLDGTCVDAAGNAATATASGINIDKTPPGTFVHSLSPTPDASGRNYGSVAVEFSCSDPLSGADSVFGVYGRLTPPPPNGTEYFTVPMIVGEGADQSVTGLCADRAGNYVLDTVSGITVERGPPPAQASGLTPVSYALSAAVAVLGSIVGILAVTVRRLAVQARGLGKRSAPPPPSEPETPPEAR